MKFYVLECDGVYPMADLADSPKKKGSPWIHGGLVSDPGELMVYTIDRKHRGNLKAMYNGPEYPIMREDLIAALRAAGVDNLQLFDAVVRDPKTKVEYTNYKAFNIIGVVSAADMEKSELMGTSDSSMIDVDFESLAIDETKAAPFKLFRLAESVNAIMISADVRKMIERHEIPGMVFYEPSDWSG